MTIIEKTDNKLTIPVGIGVVQTETTRNFYNTSDATATANDILVDKVAYGKYGKLTGTLDLIAEKEISYQDGYETGKTDGYENGYDIGYGNGYTEGETNGYNNGYNIGVADGVVEGKNEIIEGQNDATITPQNVLRGYVGYGKDNERIVGESDAITTIDVGASNIKFGYSRFSEIPSYYNFDNVTNMDSMFISCSNLTTVSLFNTSKVTTMYNMFYGCSNLTTVPLFDTSNVTNMSYIFGYCSKLTSIPEFDTSKVTTMSNMFYQCSKLTSVPALNTSKCENFNEMFSFCDEITTIPEMDWSGYKGEYGGSEVFGLSYSYAKNIENIGGFKDAGKSYTSSNSYNAYKDIIICYNPKLTYQSCMNVINKVYDMNLNTQNTYTPKIRFHATPYALLSADDIAIATAKGWTVQAG